MKSYVRDSISTEKNRKKLKKDQRMKAIFLLAALLSSSAIAIIIIFISVKGISPFLSGYSYGQQDIVSFLTGMMWRKDQGIYGVGFIVINTLVSAFGALVISFPLSVLTALFIAKIAPKHVRGHDDGSGAACQYTFCCIWCICIRYDYRAGQLACILPWLCDGWRKLFAGSDSVAGDYDISNDYIPVNHGNPLCRQRSGAWQSCTWRHADTDEFQGYSDKCQIRNLCRSDIGHRQSLRRSYSCCHGSGKQNVWTNR